jgi:tryptophan synthase alpha chain
MGGFQDTRHRRFFMSALDHLFADLRTRGEKALMPFVTAGDPSLQTTQQVLRLLSDLGCHLAEVGIPYSDPIADGPVIQASYTRALGRRLKLEQILASVHEVKPSLQMPLVSMVSYAIVLRHGLEKYVADARESGFSGLIVPDLLIEEAAPLAKLCAAADLSLIQLITPTTPRERAIRIARESTGFIYYVSVTGITGERTELPPEVVDQVGWLRQQTTLPICIGFGISRPEHVRMLAPVADGVIVGSALVRQIARLEHESPDVVLPEISELITGLRDALK